ncbi:MAG: SpoIIE family protein phosphatase [Clostridia bacterium]
MITMLLLAAVFFGVTEYRNYRLSQLTSEASRKQQVSIALNTNAIMTEVIQNNLNRITGLEASVTDEIFQGAKSRVTLLSQFATRMFANPDSYSPKPWAPPDPAMEGQLSAQVILADNVDPSDPKLQATVGFAANLNNLMLSICRTFESDNIYVGLPEGAFLSVSENASTWYLEDGSLMSYDARTRFWYKQAVEAKGLIFTDVETDANTGELSLVCATPVYGPDGELRAVVGTDLFLSTMLASIQQSGSDGSYLLIINKNGHIIASSLEDSELQTTASENAKDLRQSGNQELAKFIRNAMDGQTDVLPVTLDSGVYYMTGAPAETVGWTVISAYPMDMAVRPARLLESSYSEIEAEATAGYRSSMARSRTIIIAGFIVLFVILSFIALMQGGKIVKPLNTMKKRISDMGEENLVFNMEDTYRTGDEIEILADSFSRLSKKTVDYVEQVRTVTAEKERISSELQMAAAIQSSMLPHIFPSFPDRKEFDLYASMDPAKEVGGDFYDFFLIDDDHLCMVIADVSGKGVPGALFMMISKVILQNCAFLSDSAEEILAQANSAICANNQADMFVTVWIGILEISTGKLTAANAGHEFPVLKRAGGKYELYKDRHGFVIGGMPGMKYRQYELQLHPGDRLFVYTDGVPEATDADSQLFGTDRMLSALNEKDAADPKEVVQVVHEAVDRFVKDAEQFDDMTMLCLDYNGPNPSAS